MVSVVVHGPVATLGSAIAFGFRQTTADLIAQPSACSAKATRHGTPRSDFLGSPKPDGPPRDIFAGLRRAALFGIAALGLALAGVIGVADDEKGGPGRLHGPHHLAEHRRYLLDYPVRVSCWPVWPRHRQRRN